MSDSGAWYNNEQMGKKFLTKEKDIKGFTLIELLVSIGIIAALSAAVVVALNPVELFRQARDTQRVSSLATLNKAINILQAGAPNFASLLGTKHQVYISLPDTASDCPNLKLILPALPADPSDPPDWTYHCATQENLLKTDGTGWLPIDLSSVQAVSIPALPKDPLNQYDPAVPAQAYFYTYATDGLGHYELNAKTESKKFGIQQ